MKQAKKKKYHDIGSMDAMLPGMNFILRFFSADEIVRVHTFYD